MEYRSDDKEPKAYRLNSAGNSSATQKATKSTTMNTKNSTSIPCSLKNSLPKPPSVNRLSTASPARRNSKISRAFARKTASARPGDATLKWRKIMSARPTDAAINMEASLH